MKDDEIIKALECCSEPAGKCCCEICPLHHREDSCTTALIKKAVELVNRQKAEIERLKNAYKQCAWERNTFMGQVKRSRMDEIDTKISGK